MPSVPTFVPMPYAALRGRMPVVGRPLIQRANNNNRNNASLPRAGD